MSRPTMRFDQSELIALARRERRIAWWDQAGEAVMRYAIAGALVGFALAGFIRAWIRWG